MTDGIQTSRRRLIAGSAASLILPATALLPGQAVAQGAAAPTAAPPAAGAGGATMNGSAVIDVDRARADPIPIALAPFAVGGGDGAEMAQGLLGVISNDLARCGLFRPLDPSSFVERNPSVEAPNFQNWKVIGAQALVTGRVTGSGGSVRVEFRLWDVLPGQQIQGTAYTATSSNWRRIGHIIADVIYERLLGEKGYFDTRICYISGTGPKARRIKRLAIMDQDGENNKFLTDGGFLALTPRFHPTSDEIAFMSYLNNKPRVYLFNLGTGRQRLLGNFDGITLSPRFSPDGGSVIMAQTNSTGGSSIVEVSVNGGGGRKLTDGSAIDVSPCFSPDSSQIVFESDRGGSQQLYVMSASGGGARRISYGNGHYATPVWSPRGDLIAFTRIGGNSFAIGVMRPDGSGERILTESWYCEGPTFCPNGRVIAYFRETSSNASGAGFSSRMYTIDVTGFNERVLNTPTDASDPAWSPLGA